MEINWTHTDCKISDIRKLSEMFIFTLEPKNTLVEEGGYKVPLLVKNNIFEERLKTYFLKDAHRVTREEILGVKWNLFITQGYYIKIVKGEATQFLMDKDKYYVSYLEIAGPLGSFQSVYKESHNNLIDKN